MIEKMKFLSITGLKSDLNRVIEQYISKYDMQIENTLSELKNVKNLYPYTENNPYRETLQKAEELKTYFHYISEKDVSQNISTENANKIIQNLYQKVENLKQELDKVENEIFEYKEKLSNVERFIGLNYDIDKVFHFKFITFRFGRMPKDYYRKFMDFVYDGTDSIFYKGQEDTDYVWGVYFVPESIRNKVDAIYASMHFERVYLPEGYEGTPKEASEHLQRIIEEKQQDMQNIRRSIDVSIFDYEGDFFSSYYKLQSYSKYFDIRKLAACTKKSDLVFYILCGWMQEKDVEQFHKDIENDDAVYCIVETDHSNLMNKPPTKLKNFFLFKPFELFVEMYGLPNTKEFDPTMLIALSYCLLFGLMFADIGQGLLLMIAGSLIAYFKKSKLAGIVARCGLFSVICGFLFGSFFGFEEVVQPLWFRPAKSMMRLPLVGNIHTIFVLSIGFGVCIIIFSMLLNTVIRWRTQNSVEALLDTNGIAGLIFYLTSIVSIIFLMKGRTLPNMIFILFILPLAVIFLKEPLGNLIQKKKEILPDNKVMFFIQGIFEIFELLLSYFSNTLSFVRVGAFAVSHAAIMEVIHMLAGVGSGNMNWAVFIFGNLFVCLIEGLIVGIQVLRLEYYELFSRFYAGNGRAFKPYGK